MSNSIIDHMLSEEGIPLVPTSGVDEAAGVYGLDSPLPQGGHTSGFLRKSSSSGLGGAASRGRQHQQQQLQRQLPVLGLASSWTGGGGAAPSTPRFSHSSSFSAYGAAGPVPRGLSAQGAAAGDRAFLSGSFAGVGGAGGGSNRGPGGLGLRGRGRARRLSVGEEEVRRSAVGSWQQFQQQRGVHSFDAPRGKASGGNGSSGVGTGRSGVASSSTAVVGDRVGAGASSSGEPTETPRAGRHSRDAAGSFFGSSSQQHTQGLLGDGHLGAGEAGQQVVPVMGSSVQDGPSAAAAASASPVIQTGSSATAAPPVAASMAAAGGAGPSPGDTDRVSSPISQLAARASAVAAAVAAAASAAEAGEVAGASSRLLQATSSSSNSFNSSQNNSAAFATSASNLASEAALFSRSGWASMDPQHQHHQQQPANQQQQQLAGQFSAGGRGSSDWYVSGPMSLVETPKESRRPGQAAAVLPSLAPALAEQ